MPNALLTPGRLRHGLVAVAVGVGLAAMAASPAAADVAGDRQSPTVVAAANVALEAHDVFSVAGTPGAFVAYLATRNAAADAVAVEVGLSPLDVRAAWARADLAHQKAVLAALSQLGAQYRYASSDPAVGFDCSGLMAYAWGRAGVTLANQSSAQIDAAAPRDRSTARAGDLVQYPGHVMMYLGVGDAIVHAANQATDVELGTIHRDVRFGDPTG